MLFRSNPELSVDGRCSCRHQHGHNGKVIVYLMANSLNNQGMVMDFKELQFFKVWLDTVLDHKMILDINDPSLSHFYPILRDIDLTHGESADQVLEYHYSEGYFTLWSDIYSETPIWEREIYEGLVLVDFVQLLKIFLNGYLKLSKEDCKVMRKWKR